MKDEHVLKISEYLEIEAYDDIERILDDISIMIEEDDYDYWLLRAMVAKQKGSDEDLFNAILGGMKANPTEYDMYEHLGDYYIGKNVDKAYLCYEMAYYYCTNECGNIILEKMNNISGSGKLSVKPVSIVIPSYNCKEMMQGCIESIRRFNPRSSYEIVVVDNASTDGILEWLKEQDDIVLVANRENTGFPVACNQGINAAKRENDIFLLNNDTYVPLNAIFWLRMGLYEDKKVGATGSVSNHAVNYQQIEEKYDRYEDYITWARYNNILSKNPYEKKIYLMGFALMMKRRVLDEIGLLDEKFSPGNYEDNDIGFRMNKAGYKMLLCHNSFILHYGHTSFKKDPDAFVKLYYKNKKYFNEKWGADFSDSYRIQTELLSAIKEKSDERMKILEVGCGLGMTMSRLKYLYPNSIVKGIESNEAVAGVAVSYMDVLCGDIENMEFTFEKESFDYVIFGNSLEKMKEPLSALEKIKPYIKKGGCVVATLANMLNASVVLPLLNGNLTYGNDVLLNKRYHRMFTRKEGIKLFISAGLNIENIYNVVDDRPVSENMRELYSEIVKLKGVVGEEEFNTIQYIFVGRV